MKLLLVDDHVIVRKSLQHIIHNEFPAAECLECQDGQSCIDLLKKEKIDLVILDMSLPDMDGITLAEWILNYNPAQMILFFSSSPTEAYAKKLYQKGVMGYLNKQEKVNVIADALKMILLEKKQYVDEKFRAALNPDPLIGNSPNPIGQLSARELSIAQLLAHGKSYAEIAGQLNIEPSTISSYKSKIFTKFDATTLQEFLIKAKLYKII